MSLLMSVTWNDNDWSVGHWVQIRHRSLFSKMATVNHDRAVEWHVHLSAEHKVSARPQSCLSAPKVSLGETSGRTSIAMSSGYRRLVIVDLTSCQRLHCPLPNGKWLIEYMNNTNTNNNKDVKSISIQARPAIISGLNSIIRFSVKIDPHLEMQV